MTERSLNRRLRELSGAVYGDIFWMVAYSALGGLAPFLISWSVKAVRTTSLPDVTEFARAGEFTLYAASFVASAAYALAHDRKKSAFPGRLGLNLLCGVLICSAIIGYMLVAPDVLSVPAFSDASKSLYAWLTIGLFLSSIAFYVIVSVIDATRGLPDVRYIDDRQVGDLSRRLNELPE